MRAFTIPKDVDEAQQLAAFLLSCHDGAKIITEAHRERGNPSWTNGD